MANRWGNSGDSVRLYFWGLQKSLQMVTAVMKLKDAYSLVLELTDDNFESRITDTGSSGLMLVEFFAPW